jgi:HAE1 family hydrophobic/amphiphilic exporter-1
MIAGNIYKGIISLSLTLRYPILALCVMACAWAVGEAQKLEKEFIGIAEQNKFTIFIEMPTGTKIDVTNDIVQKIEKIVTQTADVRASTSKVEPWSSKIYVELTSFEKRKRPVSAVINELRPITTKFEPAFIYFEEPEEVGTKEIILEIFGYDYAILKNLAVQIAQRIQGIPKFTDTKIRMREGRPELQLLVDKMQAAYFGLTVENISLTLHTNTRGLVATRYRGKQEPLIRVRGASDNKLSQSRTSTGIKRTDADPARETRETETIVRLEEQFRKSFEALRRTVFIGPEGRPVYLHQVAKFKFDVGPSEIWRKNKSRMVQVSANTGGTALGTAAANVKEALKDLKLPKDTFWRIGGQYDKMLQNQRELTIAGILSLVLVFMILASLFESLSQPFIILTTVPLAAIGAIWALRYTGKPIGMGVLVGGIMLGGIAVNNAIVLIDRINFFLKHEEYFGKPRKAAVDASYDRLRPILITTLTTIFGLVPMALDKSESANLWAPLAITVIGGMTVSSFLTLFVIPGMFMIFNDLGWIFKFIFRWKK